MAHKNVTALVAHENIRESTKLGRNIDKLTNWLHQIPKVLCNLQLGICSHRLGIVVKCTSSIFFFLQIKEI